MDISGSLASVWTTIKKKRSINGRKNITPRFLLRVTDGFLSVAANGIVWRLECKRTTWRHAWDWEAIRPGPMRKRYGTVLSVYLNTEENVLYYLTDKRNLFTVDLRTGKRCFRREEKLDTNLHQTDPNVLYSLWIGASRNNKEFNLRFHVVPNDLNHLSRVDRPQWFCVDESRNAILLFIKDRSRNEDVIKEYSLKSKSWSTVLSRKRTTHHRRGSFNINWLKNAICTRDRRYIISFSAGYRYGPYGGGRRQHQDGFITVLDTVKREMWRKIIHFEWNKYEICNHRSIITDDDPEILCCGYINRLYRKRGFKNLTKLPYYLMQLISKWFTTESTYYLFVNFANSTGRCESVSTYRISSIDKFAKGIVKSWSLFPVPPKTTDCRL